MPEKPHSPSSQTNGRAPTELRYTEVKAILFDALDLDEPAARRELVLEATEGRPALRQEALELLGETDGLERFMESGPNVAADAEDSVSRGPAPPLATPPPTCGIRLIRPLGFGGMGVVYLGEQERPKRLVAVKVLHGSSGDPGGGARFLREIEILGRLRHPGIARVHDAGLVGDDGSGASWFSMEYIEGEPMNEFARNAELSRRERVALAARVADIVSYAHKKGVLHRDLKPENILVDASGDPHLLDFGVARLEEDALGQRLPSIHTVTGALLGTVAYMSPEQARGASVDVRSDVFSLGVILYELLSDRLPFEARGRSLEQLVKSLSTDEPTPLPRSDPSFSPDLEVVLMTALSTDPAERYGSMAEFREDLLRWLDDRPVLARKPTLFHQVRKLVRRNRGLTVGTLLVVSTLVLALAFTLRALRDSRMSERRSAEALADVVSFSRGYSIDDLVERAQGLWPADAETLDGLTTLLGEAEAVAEAIPKARAHLADLSTLGREGALQARYGSELDGRWVLEMQEALVSRMEALEEGLIKELRWRTEFAQAVERELMASEDAWERTSAFLKASPLYQGVHVVPEAGLIPLGPDPGSELLEFALLVPGCTVPVRTETAGELELHETTTIVLVLLPGGSVQIGAQGEDKAAPFYDPETKEHYWPPVERRLLPFLMSKFEVTQHQWLALEGSNPSYWHAGKEHGTTSITLRHPVDSITWEEAVEFTRKLGLTLPTEVQFEYGARGSLTTPTWWGALDPLDPNKANFRLWREPNTLDTYRLHAPIGVFPANPFGLHEVLGNMAEMCLDDYKVRPWEEPHEVGTGLVLADGGGEQSVRGGDYDGKEDITVSTRGDIKRKTRSRRIGFRPIKYLQGHAPTPARIPGAKK